MHRSNSLADLLLLVDRLTQNHTSVVLVEDDVEGEQKVVIQHEPLLKQLRDMVHSSIGSTVQGAGLASERNVLDADALEQYESISRQITRLYKDVSDATPFVMPESNLRHWYIEFKRRVESRKVSSEVVDSVVRKVSGFVSSIENKLNPPTLLEITAPCPRCEARNGVDEKGVFRPAIIVESRITQYRSLDHSRAKCIACGAVWLHGRGMRQLRYEIDHRDVTRHAEEKNIEIIENMFDNSAILIGRNTSVPENSEGA